MKKTLTLLMALLILCALALPVLGIDDDWTPDDAFYAAHAAECARSDEGYYAEEDTAIYASPEDATLAGVIPAGESRATYFIWRDKQRDEWGYVETWEGAVRTSGWVNITHPDTEPAPTYQSGPVVLITSVLALAAVGIVLFGRPIGRKKG